MTAIAPNDAGISAFKNSYMMVEETPITIE